MRLQLNIETNETEIFLSVRQWSKLTDFIVSFLDRYPSNKIMIKDNTIDGMNLTYKGTVKEAEELLTLIRNIYYDLEELDSKHKKVFNILCG